MNDDVTFHRAVKEVTKKLNINACKLNRVELSTSKLPACVNGRMDVWLSVGVSWCCHFQSMKDNKIVSERA